MRSKMTVALGACLFLTGLTYAAAIPYRAIVATESLGISNVHFAIIMAVGGVTGAMASLLLGAVSDLAPDRRVIVLGCAVVASAGYGMVAFVPNAMVFAIAFGAVIPLGNAVMSQLFAYARSYYGAADPDAAVFMMSALRSLVSLAWVIVPPLAGWIATQGTPVMTFQISTVAVLGVAVIFAALMFAPQAAQSAAAPQAKRAPFYIAPARRWGLAGVTLIRCALIMSATVTPLVLRVNYGASLAQVGINASLAAAMEVPLMLAWAYAAKRWSSETIMAGNALIFTAYFLAIPFAGSVVGMLLLQPLNAIPTAALIGLTIGYVQEAIAGRLGTSTALLDSLSLVATWIGSLLFAALAQPEDYFAMVSALGLCSLLGGALIWLKGREPHP